MLSRLGSKRVKGMPCEPLTLEQSLRLAGQNLLGMLDPEDNYLPYWELTVYPDYRATLGKWWPAHNIGRWLDAMLRLEEAIGFEIPKVVETAMVKNAQPVLRQSRPYMPQAKSRPVEWQARRRGT